LDAGFRGSGGALLREGEGFPPIFLSQNLRLPVHIVIRPNVNCPGAGDSRRKRRAIPRALPGRWGLGGKAFGPPRQEESIRNPLRAAPGLGCGGESPRAHASARGSRTAAPGYAFKVTSGLEAERLQRVDVRPLGGTVEGRARDPRAGGGGASHARGCESLG
jgi:hypothetical protein